MYDELRANKIKVRLIRLGIKQALTEFGIDDESEVDRILELVRHQNEY